MGSHSLSWRSWLVRRTTWLVVVVDVVVVVVLVVVGLGVVRVM